MEVEVEMIPTLRTALEKKKMFLIPFVYTDAAGKNCKKSILHTS